MQEDNQNQDVQSPALEPERPAPDELPADENSEPAEILGSDEEPPQNSKIKRLGIWLKSHKKISIPLAILLLLIILAAVPVTRYKAAALVLKKDISVKVTDTTAGTPVSGALVTSDGISATTNASGVAKLHLPVGKHAFRIIKKYYANAQATALVPIGGQKNISVQMTATGRQVGVTIKDLLSGKVLSEVNIQVAGVSAKTDDSGKALLVVPAGVQEEQASLSLSGYNDAKATLKVSNQSVVQNDLTLTPSGSIYFLSKRTGKLNVMKANLDGSDSQVVVAATGYESTDSSAFSTSPDGKYAAYETQRSAGDKTPQLFILSTNDDRLLTFDSGNYNFSLIDWFGDTIIYKSVDNGTDAWQAGHEKLKSYNAATGKTTVLDSSAGTDSDKGAGENYDAVYLSAGKVVFDKWWNSTGSDDLTNHKNSVVSVDPDGQNKQTVGSYAAGGSSISLYHYAPNSFYIQIYDNSGSDTYYDYTVGGNFKQIDKPSGSSLYNNPTYYFSPGRNQTYWSESRDGKDTLITADAYGSESSQKIEAVGYEAAGWYTNKYLISTNKDQDELYVMAVGGQKPVKIADYQSTYVY